MPQLVRDLRYCSHIDDGVEMGESTSLNEGTIGQHEGGKDGKGRGLLPVYVPVTALDIVIVTT